MPNLLGDITALYLKAFGGQYLETSERFLVLSRFQHLITGIKMFPCAGNFLEPLLFRSGDDLFLQRLT